MLYKTLADCYDRLESTAKKLEKRGILGELYKKSDDLYPVVLLSMGTVFSAGAEELGIAGEMMKRAIIRVYGVSGNELTRKFKETGDLGLTAEFFAKNRRQMTFAKKELTVRDIFETLKELPVITGAGSQDKKVSLIAKLISSATPLEARYLVRTILGEMRIGVAAGIVRDAIAQAFKKDGKDVEKLFDVLGDYGEVAELAKKGKMTAEIRLMKPVRVMLADRAPDLKTALVQWDSPTIEVKYDGFRISAHKKGNEVRIFSRRLEDVTRQFPEIADWIRKNVMAKECIIEGEVIAVDASGRPMPFQVLSRRIQRKYDIEKLVKEIPIQVDLFDLIYFNGESWMKRPLRERWEKLDEIVNETGRLRLAEHIRTKDLDEAQKFYSHSLEIGEEGVIVKNLDAHYQPGMRVGYWLKVKPIMEPLDLVIVGAEWGEGKRAKWFGSLILAARRGNEFAEVGRMGSGLTEEQMGVLTKRLKKLITREEGKVIYVRPEVVIEVGYEEIQKSPKYPSGYALRFPRLLRIRDDKSTEDINTVKDVEKLFGMQRGRK